MKRSRAGYRQTAYNNISRKFTAQKRYLWECNCGFTFNSSSLLSGKEYENHLNKHHDGQDNLSLTCRPTKKIITRTDSRHSLHRQLVIHIYENQDICKQYLQDNANTPHEPTAADKRTCYDGIAKKFNAHGLKLWRCTCNHQFSVNSFFYSSYSDHCKKEHGGQEVDSFTCIPTEGKIAPNNRSSLFVQAITHVYNHRADIETYIKENKPNKRDTVTQVNDISKAYREKTGATLLRCNTPGCDLDFRKGNLSGLSNLSTHISKKHRNVETVTIHCRATGHTIIGKKREIYKKVRLYILSVMPQIQRQLDAWLVPLPHLPKKIGVDKVLEELNREHFRKFKKHLLRCGHKECDFEATSRNTIFSHFRYHHAGDDIKVFVCDITDHRIIFTENGVHSKGSIAALAIGYVADNQDLIRKKIAETPTPAPFTEERSPKRRKVEHLLIDTSLNLSIEDIPNHHKPSFHRKRDKLFTLIKVVNLVHPQEQLCFRVTYKHNKKTPSPEEVLEIFEDAAEYLKAGYSIQLECGYTIYFSIENDTLYLIVQNPNHQTFIEQTFKKEIEHILNSLDIVELEMQQPYSQSDQGCYFTFLFVKIDKTLCSINSSRVFTPSPLPAFFLGEQNEPFVIFRIICNNSTQPLDKQADALLQALRLNKDYVKRLLPGNTNVFTTDGHIYVGTRVSNVQTDQDYHKIAMRLSSSITAVLKQPKQSEYYGANCTMFHAAPPSIAPTFNDTSIPQNSVKK